MSSLNKVLLIGRLGQDPEKKFTPSGVSVARVSLATNEVFLDRNKERKERTEWHRVVLWGKLADLAESYLKKGSQVFIEGSLRANDWTDKEGNKRTTIEIHASAMKFLDSKRSGSEESYGSSYTPPAQPADKKEGGNAPQEEEYIEDDIPF